MKNKTVFPVKKSAVDYHCFYDILDRLKAKTGLPVKYVECGLYSTTGVPGDSVAVFYVGAKTAPATKALIDKWTVICNKWETAATERNRAADRADLYGY